MFNCTMKPKVTGFLMLIPAVLLFFAGIIGIFIVPAFGFSSGVTFLQMLPFFLLMLFVLVLMLICIYISFRYLKNKPFEKNKSLGTVLIVGSIFYFFYTTFGYVISNLFLDDQGGYLRPVIALFFLLIFLPLGLGLKNGYR